MRSFGLLLLLGISSLVASLPSGSLEKRKTPWTKPNRPHRANSIQTVRNAVNYGKARRYVDARLAERDEFIPNESVAPTTSAPNTNIWRSLSNDEAASVIAYLHKQDELNLTKAEDAGSWDNAISVVDVAMPNKTDALAYLSGNSSAPDRYAYASIMFGATDEPYIQNFIIGPLPISNSTTYSSYDYVSTKGVAKIRNYQADDDALYNYTLAITGDVSDIVSNLLGINASDPDTYAIFGIDPLWHQNGRIVNWMGYWLAPDTLFDGETLQPMGLYMKLDTTGRDPSKWSLTGWLYDDVFYPSTAAFRKAWAAGNITHQNKVENGAWISTDYTGTALPLDVTTPPIQVETGPKRYSVDVTNRYVEWMDFSFYITFTRDTGVRLFNLKYKGERVIYEMGLQEAIASYAGNDPVQSGTSYLDTYYGFGPYAFELVPNYDCPAYATYLNATFHADEESRTHRNGICVFEADAGFAIQRHSASVYTSVSKNVVLTLRSVSTVGNYDYTFDYVFYLDGTIEIVVRASGYIQAAFYAKNGDYGYQIHDALSGSMHDHSLNFKVDLDVLGTQNSLAAHIIQPCNISYDWNNYTRSTMKLEKTYIDNEDDSEIDWGANGQTFYFIVNKDKKNKFGEDPGYRIMPSRGGAGMHLTIKDSPNLLNSQYFGTHSFFVTRQKDSEPRSASAWNDFDTANPIVDFSKFLDGESLDQEDLTLWVNLGMHHVPHTGDLPNTVMSTAQSGIQISPHNYLYSDPSRQSKQQIRIDRPNADNNVTDVHTFGVQASNATINIAALRPDYYDYAGDQAVRKFPYDPEHPFNDTEAII